MDKAIRIGWRRRKEFIGVEINHKYAVDDAQNLCKFTNKFLSNKLNKTCHQYKMRKKIKIQNKKIK